MDAVDVDLEGALALYETSCTLPSDGIAAASCVVVPQSQELPRRYPLDVGHFTGFLAALHARLYFREGSRAITYSSAHWNPETVFPYVIELVLRVPDRATQEPSDNDWFWLTIAYPSEVDPRTPEALPIIRALLHRAMTHEADESFVLPNDERPFDPHAGVEAPCSGLVEGALCL